MRKIQSKAHQNNSILTSLMKEVREVSFPQEEASKGVRCHTVVKAVALGPVSHMSADNGTQRRLIWKDCAGSNKISDYLVPVHGCFRTNLI